MEFLFRRHFWIVNLAFIFLVAIFLARIVNVFVEARLAGLPKPKAVVASARPMAVRPRAAINAEKLSKLLGVPLPKEPEVTAPTEVKVDLNAEPVRTSLRLKLLGTLISLLPEWSVASIQDVTSLKTATYMVGDMVQTAKVLEIERTRVIILNNNRREFIDSTPGDGTGAPPPPAMVAPIASTPPPPGGAAPGTLVTGAGVKQIDENNYTVARSEIDKTLSNLNDVAMQARIVPAFKDGVSQGFKLFSIRPDSIYTKIGIQNGDVIKRINGFDMNSPEKALEVYTKLKEANRIDIEIERNGATMRKTYAIGAQ